MAVDLCAGYWEDQLHRAKKRFWKVMLIAGGLKRGFTYIYVTNSSSFIFTYLIPCLSETGSSRHDLIVFLIEVIGT